MQYVLREQLPEHFKEMLETESHHNHPIIKDEYGTFRWEKDEFIDKLIEYCNLNDIVRGFYKNGGDKNTESYRELYRRMGYSLDGYWEVFYWEVNNGLAGQYNPPSVNAK